eukprot:749140-Hanusia_phi.AAC.1
MQAGPRCCLLVFSLAPSQPAILQDACPAKPAPALALAPPLLPLHAQHRRDRTVPSECPGPGPQPRRIRDSRTRGRRTGVTECRQIPLGSSHPPAESDTAVTVPSRGRLSAARGPGPGPRSGTPGRAAGVLGTGRHSA